MVNIAFLNQLGAARSDAEFARTAAGLVALQVYDSIKSHGFDPFVHQDALERVEDDIAKVETESGVGPALQALVAALPFWDSNDGVRIGRRAVYTALLVYGQRVADEGEWKLAATVYALVGMDAELDGETWLAAEARLLMGRALRMCADWESSHIAYRRAYELGTEARDTYIALRARIGEANNLWTRGDFPAARKLLALTARTARQSCPAVLPRITLALAGLANAAGEYERAIHLTFRLLTSLPDDDELAYYALVDLAAFLTDYGLPDVASASLLLVERAAPEARIRRHAKLNRFFLAARHDEEAAFDALRAELGSDRLTPRQQTQYALFSAQGYRRFSKLELAKSEADRALTLATDFQQFQLVFEAEEALRDIEVASAAARSADNARRASSRSHKSSTVDYAAATEADQWTIRRTPADDGNLSPRMRRVARSLQEMGAARFAATALEPSSAEY
ncbi:MAG TPA: hypothetical protein VIG47_16720 [Gemmatimonadaceae bacterium]